MSNWFWRKLSNCNLQHLRIQSETFKQSRQTVRLSHWDDGLTFREIDVNPPREKFGKLQQTFEYCRGVKISIFRMRTASKCIQYLSRKQQVGERKVSLVWCLVAPSRQHICQIQLDTSIGDPNVAEPPECGLNCAPKFAGSSPFYALECAGIGAVGFEEIRRQVTPRIASDRLDSIIARPQARLRELRKAMHKNGLANPGVGTRKLKQVTRYPSRKKAFKGNKLSKTFRNTLRQNS